MPYNPRKCTMCSAEYNPTSSSQKACASCKAAYRKQQNVEALRQLRLKQGKTPVGTILNCPECGEDFPYKSGPQHRCPQCQRKAEVRKIHEWLASDKDRLKQYTDKTRDNYHFSGNRKSALERDNYTCQHCGTQDDLQVHHIDGNGMTSPRESRNNDLDNLITLCRRCHTKEHHRIRHSNCAPQMKMPL